MTAEDMSVKTYRMVFPDNSVGETEAPSRRKAVANFAWRLRRLGMFHADAREYADENVEEGQ